MRRIGHMYLISVVAPSSAVTTPSVTHDVTLCSTTAQTAIAPNTNSDAGQQRHDDADQPDGDGQRNEDDSAGAHGSNLRCHGRFARTHWMLPRLFVRTPTRPRSSRMSPSSSSAKKWTPPLGSRRNSACGASQRWAPSRPSGRRAAAPSPSRPGSPPGSVSAAAPRWRRPRPRSRRAVEAVGVRAQEADIRPRLGADGTGQHRFGDVEPRQARRGPRRGPARR